MQGTTQPIERRALLEIANQLIRDHEDTLAGIEATNVVQRNGVFGVQRRVFILMNKVCRQRRALPYLTCSSISLMSCQISITRLINRQSLMGRLSA